VIGEGLRPLGGHAAGPVVTLIHGNQVLNTVYVHEDRTDDILAKMGAASRSEASARAVRESLLELA